MVRENPLVRLEAGDRFYILMGSLPGTVAGRKKSDLAVDVATVLRRDYMLDLKHYIDACRQEVCGIMSIFHMGHEGRMLAKQRTLFGRPLALEVGLLRAIELPPPSLIKDLDELSKLLTPTVRLCDVRGVF